MSTNNEKAKADFIEACTKDHPKDTCELMWNKAVAEVGDKATYTPIEKDRGYTEVVQENEKLKVRIERLETQLRQDNTLMQRLNDVKKAEEEADKERLIIDIMNNSQYTKDSLTSKTYGDLKTIADALEHTEKHFASVTADSEQMRKLREPKLTVGEWDNEKKQWKGGK